MPSSSLSRAHAFDGLSPSVSDGSKSSSLNDFPSRMTKGSTSSRIRPFIEAPRSWLFSSPVPFEADQLPPAGCSSQIHIDGRSRRTTGVDGADDRLDEGDAR